MNICYIHDSCSLVSEHGPVVPAGFAVHVRRCCHLLDIKHTLLQAGSRLWTLRRCHLSLTDWILLN